MAESIEKIMTSQGNPGQAPTLNYKRLAQECRYRFMDNAFEGAGGFRDGTYLIPHSREFWYDKRCELSFYRNFVRPILRAMIDPVFVKDATRKVRTPEGTEITDSKFTAFIWDVDNAGTYLQDFSNDTIEAARLHGIVFVIVENFKPEEMPETEIEAVAQRKYPYLYRRYIYDVEGYECDKFGNIVSITFKEDMRKEKGIDGKETTIHILLKWDNEKSQVIERNEKGEMKVVSENVHGLGYVPVISVVSARRKKTREIYVDPPLYDIARLNHTLFNKDSEIREIERNQGFSLLVVQTDKPANLSIGTSNVLFIGTQTSIAPFFAAPNTGVQATLMEYSKEIREAIFQIAEQNGVVGVTEAKSGIALQWEFFARESVLKKTARMATIFEETVAEYFRDYTGDDFVYVVEYPYSFQPNDKTADLGTIQSYVDLGVPPLAKALAMEKATRIMFPDDDEIRVAEAIKEIRSQTEDDVEGVNADDKAEAEGGDESGAADGAKGADGNGKGAGGETY